MKRHLYLTLLSAAFIGGCSSATPQLIRRAPADDIRVADVQQDPGQFNGTEVRWGGSIISVENYKQDTLIELLSRPLSSAGKPAFGKPGQGRFLVRVEGFLDPEEYPKGRLLTATGRVVGIIERPVGEFPYHYPVLGAKAYYLWPEELDHRYPYYRDPFFNPWHPWHPWYRQPYYW